MVDVSVKQEGSFIDGTPPTSVTFGVGDPTVALEIATEDDDVGEDDGSITVTVTSVPSGIEISQTAASATVAVVDSPTATVPDAPTGLSATLGDQQVVLNWTAPASNGGATITDYEYEQNGSGTWTSTGSTATNLHGDGPHQRHGLHVPGAGGEQHRRKRCIHRGDRDAFPRSRSSSGSSSAHRRSRRAALTPDPRRVAVGRACVPPQRRRSHSRPRGS